MPIDIDPLSFEQLLERNRRLVARLEALESMQVQRQMRRFHPGQWVSFEHQGRRILATLVTYNRKTVTVVTDHGQRWNVSPHLLAPAKQPGTGTPSPKGAKKKRIRSPGLRQ